MSYPTRRYPLTPLRIVLLLCLILASAPLVNAQTPSASSPPSAGPLPNAHAHNDYLHDRPLLDALDQGFCSVEADVFLVEGELWVAHTKAELSPERTLRRLYLDPLRERIVHNNSSVFGDGQPLTLLIDLKSEGEATYQALDKLLEEYREILTYSENGVEHPGPVVAIISGALAAFGRATLLRSLLRPPSAVHKQWVAGFLLVDVVTLPKKARQEPRPPDTILQLINHHERCLRFPPLE
jgi:hypothetical protein